MESATIAAEIDHVSRGMVPTTADDQPMGFERETG
jgi:hypothetical protein